MVGSAQLPRLPSRDATAVRQAREDLLERGTLPAGVRGMVADSWLRSAAAGVNADSGPPPITLAADLLADYRAGHPLAAIFPLLYDVAGRAAEDCDSVLAVADERGRLLWVCGKPGVLRHAESIGFVEGAQWDEPHAGTNAPGTALCLDAPVTINVSYNCLDRHVLAGRGDRVAFYWRGEEGEERELTYAQLLDDVQRLANALKARGIGKGDVFEVNEAFAAQALAVARELDLPPERTNPNGSGISLGHPIGATGAILAVKSLYELKRTGGRYALATMCIGGGQGIAAIFERP